jgi:transcriptional regulator with XRE-family HTH domain
MSQQAIAMPRPVILKTGLTLPAVFSLHGVADVAAKKPESLTLGSRIAGLRRDKGMTQVELAERLDVSQPVVSDYENDVIRLPADVVVQIAAILDVSTDELLGLKVSARNSGGIKNRRLYRRLQEIEKLPRRDQDALLRTIEAFIGKTA